MIKIQILTFLMYLFLMLKLMIKKMKKIVDSGFEKNDECFQLDIKDNKQNSYCELSNKRGRI